MRWEHIRTAKQVQFQWALCLSHETVESAHTTAAHTATTHTYTHAHTNTHTRTHAHAYAVPCPTHLGAIFFRLVFRQALAAVWSQEWADVVHRIGGRGLVELRCG